MCEPWEGIGGEYRNIHHTGWEGYAVKRIYSGHFIETEGKSTRSFKMITSVPHPIKSAQLQPHGYCKIQLTEPLYLFYSSTKQKKELF